MDKNKARSVGFTHQGKYYGIPLWITHSATPMIAAKWYPLQVMVTLLQFVESHLQIAMLVDGKYRHKVTHVKLI